MPIFLLIIQIIGAIPTIIKIVKEIISILRDMRKEDADAIRSDLKSAVYRAQADKKAGRPVVLAQELETLLGRLREKHGSKEPRP